MANLSDSIYPLISKMNELLKQKADLLSVETQLIMSMEHPDIDRIDRAVDELTDIMIHGFGAADFWQLYGLLEKLAPEKARTYMQFYKEYIEPEKVLEMPPSPPTASAPKPPSATGI